MSLQKTLVAYARCTCAEGAVVTNRAYNCTVAFVADGNYNVTVGKGGADNTNVDIEVETELAADDAAGLVASSGSSTDTVKKVLFRNATNGTLREPAGFAVSVYRMSSSINGS